MKTLLIFIGLLLACAARAQFDFNGPMVAGFSKVAPASGGGGGDITSGLIGWWKFTEGSGTTTADSSGNGLTGTLVNSPTWTTGPNGGGALSFTTTSQNVSLGTVNATTLSAITISFWENITTTANESKPLDWGNIFIKVANGGTPNVKGTVSGSSSTAAATTQTVFDSTWHFITYTADNSGQTIYFDGAASGTATQTFTPQNIALYFCHNCTGIIADMRIYNRVLSSTEVSTLFSNGAK